ncbi:MFS transporter [Arthrobacter echini]|uniref:MFS transporter n=1 Tax=Arthrobacter echini TaxID=1529066 RepID=A0A4S5E186_9MICC|nr:MFS transporter [Arthrobacter echini]THJ65114.1 MFS transporter [Arthrobacter echini]
MKVPETSLHKDDVGRVLGRRFWILWTSSGWSNLADGSFHVVLPLVAVSFTQSPALVAGLTFALTLPWLLFALIAGALADRSDRRVLMVAANGARAVLLIILVLVIVLDAGSIALLYVVAFGIGTAETVYDTAAQSILPQLVRREQLSRANGRLYAVELTTNQFVGPPLGGLLVAAGVMLAFGAQAAMWVVALGSLLLVRGSFKPARTSGASVRADIAEGLRFLWSHAVLRALALFTGIFNLATSAMMAVFVLFAVGPASAMGLTELGYGVLLSVVAAGSVLGSLLAGWAERRIGRALLISFAILGGVVFIGTPALTSSALLVGGGFFIGGAAIVMGNVIIVSLRQRITPNELLGRVNSAYRLVGWGTMPIGALLGGFLAQALGLQPTFAIMALVVLALVALLPLLTNPALDAVEVA